MRATDNRSHGGTAQTSVDFLIGFSIFAVTLLFVLQLATGSIVNTAPQSQTEEALADRAAELAHQNLTSDKPTLLETDYFNRTQTALGIPPGEYDINVTVKPADGQGVCSLSNNCTTGSGGSVPDTTARIAGEKRVGSVENETSVIDVRVWENRTVGPE